MHLLLTDQLICPRCSPAAGLILLADRVEARRVYTGRLGCPSCRQDYEVRDGVAHLVVDETTNAMHEVAIDAEKLAALLGVHEGPAMLLLLGRFEDQIDALADMLSEIELILAHGSVQAAEERMGVSRLRIGDVVPLHDRGMRGAAVGDGTLLAMVSEAARVIGLAARLVILGASDEVRAWLPDNGLRILVDAGEILVAVRHA